MNQKDEMNLAEQIGDLGGEPSNSMIGKKIENMPGRKKISKSEESDMADFLTRSSGKLNISIDGDDHTAKVSDGWNPIRRNELGIRSKFYPEDWVFYIRPATVEAIKNWSAIDEERIDIVNTVFNDIIRSCVSIKGATGNIPWNRINSWDRFWFILKVRELTFKTGEAKIEFTDTCPECDNEIVYKLTPTSLFYEFPDSDIVDKHWNAVDRLWYIDPKQYDLDKPAIKLYVPTLEKDQAILDWAITKTRENKKIDNNFLRFLPWLLSKVPKDQQVLDKFITEAHGIYKSWDVDMFEFIDDVVRNITINPSEKLRQVCPHCGEEVVSNVRFPNGVKALFRTEAKHAKFGSR